MFRAEQIDGQKADGVFRAGTDARTTPRGPPLFIRLLAALCGVVTVGAVVWGWRAVKPVATWTIIVTRAVSALTGIPAFFVDDVPVGVKVGVAVFLVLTAVVTWLLLAARPVPAAVPAP